MKRLWGTVCFFLSFMVLAAQAASFEEGRDYVVFNKPVSDQEIITVTEYFNYGCPACFSIEKSLQDWLEEHGNAVLFDRVPVIFSPKWNSYAKAYYVAQILDMDETVEKALFDAARNNTPKLDTNEQLIKFFVNQGSDETNAKLAVTSQALSAQVKMGSKQASEYQVNTIPAFVIAGKYKTDMRMAGNSPTRLFAIMSYLVEKTQQEFANS